MCLQYTASGLRLGTGVRHVLSAASDSGGRSALVVGGLFSIELDCVPSESDDEVGLDRCCLTVPRRCPRVSLRSWWCSRGGLR
jgi:hypothetical protein